MYVKFVFQHCTLLNRDSISCVIETMTSLQKSRNIKPFSMFELQRNAKRDVFTFEHRPEYSIIVSTIIIPQFFLLFSKDCENLAYICHWHKKTFPENLRGIEKKFVYFLFQNHVFQMFLELASTITQKLMNGSTWIWRCFYKIWLSSI